MPDYTPNLHLAKPIVDGDDDVWGDMLNANFDTLDAVLATGAGVVISDTPPPLKAGAAWFDSVSTQLYICYQDPTGPAQWVIANNTGMSGSYLPLSGGTLTGSVYTTATGATVARSEQARAADQINLLDYILPTDTDATAGFNRAVAQAIARGAPTQIWLPSGTYRLSGTVAITTAAAQAVSILGAGSDTVLISQTADADAFQVSLTNYSGLFARGGFRLSGVTIRQDGASTTRTAVSISTTAATGTTGVPLVLDDVALVSPSATSLWGTGLSIVAVPNFTLLSRINSIYAPGVTAGTHISVRGNTSTYNASTFLRDVSLVGGNTGILFGNYLQGVHVANLNTLNMAQAITYAATAGINNEIQVSGSYLLGVVAFSATNPGVLNSVKFTSCYFDSIASVLSNGQTHVSFNNVPILHITGCTFNGPASAQTNITGLSLTGASGTTQEAVLTGNVFQAYSASGDVAVSIGSGVTRAAFHGTTFLNNATNLADAGTQTAFTDTFDNANFYVSGATANTTPAMMRGAVTQYGTFSSYDSTGANSVTLNGAAAGQQVTITAVGSDTNISMAMIAKGSGTHAYYNSTATASVGYSWPSANAPLIQGSAATASLTIRGNTGTAPLNLGNQSAGGGAINMLSAHTEASWTSQALANSGTVTIANNCSLFVNTTTGAGTGQTITLPANPVTDQELRIASVGGMTGLTIAPNAGQTVTGAMPTSITANNSVLLHFRAGTWYAFG